MENFIKTKKEKKFTLKLNSVKSSILSFLKKENNQPNLIYVKPNKSSGGFTLIEVMISVGLFSVIMIIGITAILGVNNTYRKTRSMRSAIDNVSFMMEDMARNIRLGHRYRCIQNDFENISDDISFSQIEDPADGANCRALAFEPYWDPSFPDPEDQVIYVFDIETNSVFKATNGSNALSQANSFSPMNSVDIVIDVDNSGFTVLGTDPNDGVQPMVIIKIKGTAISANNSTDFSLQTAVSQRLIDAPGP